MHRVLPLALLLVTTMVLAYPAPPSAANVTRVPTVQTAEAALPSSPVVANRAQTPSSGAVITGAALTLRGAPPGQAIEPEPPVSGEEKKSEDSPKWTDDVMAIFTIILAISTIGLWLTTYLGGRTAETTAKAAEKSAEAALASVEVAIAGQQPRWVVSKVGITIMQMTPEETTREGHFDVALSNVGGSTAEVTGTAAYLKYAPTLDSTPRYPVSGVKHSTAFGNVVTQGESFKIAQPLHGLDDAMVQALRPGTTNAFIYGYVTYRDFLDRRWRKGFVAMLDKNAEVNFSPRRIYNGSSYAPFIQVPPEAQLDAYTYTKRDDGPASGDVA